MAYLSPTAVVSPRNRIRRILEVIHDPGEEQMAVAILLWKQDDGTDAEVVAARWNGSDERPLGNPISRGQATWFLIDDYAAEETARAARAEAEKSPNSITAGYRQMAADEEREREAEEWSEALIGDAAAKG